ncbi:mucin-2-like [Carassius carassius]|uniref:mucin-2-like n=1 Tax=Carassius carassius TaxID=217509 RepID=UPI0028683DD3|nr:mucin-2-like [Carassius carassius]
MAVFSMGAVRMSQMWMLRWVVLLVGQQLIQAGFMEDYGVMGDSSDLTMWPTTPSVRASNHVNNICSMWGNFHFKTFDGDFYQFPGTCEYNLVSDCQSLIRQFSVHVKRTEHTSSPKISRVLVTINDITVEITADKVIINGKNKLLPVHVAGILVEENTIYMRLHSKMGITVMWNKEDAVMVELDSKFSNRTCGLCGDFNRAAVYNEFIQSGYEREVGYIEFGNKHKVPNPKVDCKNPSEEDDEQILVDHSEKHVSCKCYLYWSREDCDDLLKDADWFSCNKILNPEPYIEACMNDMCLYQPEDNDNSTLCATLSEYSRQCSHAGGTPPTWRRADFCAVACPYNMVHSESGSPCMDTCLHKDTNTLCEQHNIDGCFCPPGTVFDEISNMGCIPVEECQCKHDRVYSTGEVLYKHNAECICKEGNWICTSIPGPGLCAVEEGSHFTTFDGKEFTFHGDCNYVLSKDFEESKFIILGQIVPCVSLNTDTCLKSIEVMFNNDKNHVMIKADGTVQHNAIVSLPYTTADFTVFMPSSFHIMLQTTFGLQVQVQLVPLMQVYITVDQSFQGKTCGICGNFNKVLSDDLETPQGVVEGTAVSFTNAWKTQSNCPDRTERLDDPCSYSSDSKHYAEYWCSQMKEKKSLFAQCHTTVNPDSYYIRCKYSSCTCEKSEDCLCTVFSSYARACASKGIILQGWREIVCEKYTENCPASQNYSYELQGCQRTCLSLSSERQSCSVDFVPVDGCACPEGLYQDQNGLCVPMEKCPCYNNGVTVQPGTSINIKNEHWLMLKNRRGGLQDLLNTRQPPEFSQDCESGCQCPAGLLDDGRGNCVNPYDCPCPHNGEFYAPGTEIIVDCNNCTCQHGTWTCTKNICPGICTIYGSGHYKTFDQQRFGFRGECSYIAAEDKCGNKTGTFHVITENIPCGTTGTTCSKAVVILLGRTKLELYGGNVTAFDTESGPQISYNKTMIGMYLVIDADIGLTVLWDRRTTVRIILQPQHMGGVCGLCGNFNGNGKDDFTTQGSLQTTDIIEFVDSWKVLGTCPDAAPDFDPCFKNLEREPWAKLQCSIIKDSEATFKHCHNKVDPNPYYENCVKDSCACDTGGDCECFCTAVAAYAQACNEAGVCVDWRTPEICPVYCDYYNKPEGCTWHYNPCGIPCYKTCSNPFGICNNTLPNLEGCYPKCPKNEPIFDEQNQVCVKECRCCNYGGKQYDHNDTIYNIKDDMGMCYYAVCINATVIATEKPCTTPSTFTTTTSTPMAPVSTQTPHVTSTSTGTTPSPFTTSSTTTTTPLAPTPTETPSTTSTSTGTTPSTFTISSTTTTTPLQPTSRETPSTTSTSTGTTPSTFTTSSPTTTTPLPPTSTETPPTTIRDTGTTPSTFSTTSTTTTTPKELVSTETPHYKYRDNTFTIYNHFNYNKYSYVTCVNRNPIFNYSKYWYNTFNIYHNFHYNNYSHRTCYKYRDNTFTIYNHFNYNKYSYVTCVNRNPIFNYSKYWYNTFNIYHNFHYNNYSHRTCVNRNTTCNWFKYRHNTFTIYNLFHYHNYSHRTCVNRNTTCNYTPMSPVSTETPSSTIPSTGTTPSTFTTTSTRTTTPTEPVSTETPHVTSTSTETTPSPFTTTSTTTSTPMSPVSTETPSSTIPSTGTTPSTFTTTSTTTTTPTGPTTPSPFTTTSTTTSTPMSPVSTETPSSTIPSTGTTPSTFTTTSTTTTTPTGPVSTETPHVTSTSTGTTPSPFTTSSTTTTTPTEPVSTETPHVTSTSTETTPSPFTTTSTTTSTPMSPVSTETPSSTIPSTGTTPSTFTTTSTTTTTPTGPVSTETPHSNYWHNIFNIYHNFHYNNYSHRTCVNRNTTCNYYKYRDNTFTIYNHFNYNEYSYVTCVNRNPIFNYSKYWYNTFNIYHNFHYNNYSHRTCSNYWHNIFNIYHNFHYNNYSHRTCVNRNTTCNYYKYRDNTFTIYNHFNYNEYSYVTCVNRNPIFNYSKY